MVKSTDTSSTDVIFQTETCIEDIISDIPINLEAFSNSENEYRTSGTEGGRTTTTTTTTTTTSTTTPTNKKGSKSTQVQPNYPIDSRKKSEKMKHAKTSTDPRVNIHDERQKKRDACNFYCKHPEELLKIVQYVLFNFQNAGLGSFHQFKQIWKEQLQTLNFFYESQPLNKDLIHILYYGVLGYTLLNQPHINKSGILFALYILYNSQIVVPKEPIYLTINLWETLLGYCNDLRIQQFEEGYRAFRELRTSGAFVFSAQLHPISTLNIFKNNSTSLKMPVIPSELVGKDTVKSLGRFDEMKDIDERYKKEKLKANVGYTNSIKHTSDDFVQTITDATRNNAYLKHSNYIETRTPAIP